MSDEQTLAGLIADRKGTRSYDKLSKDCGGTPTAKRLHQLANVAPKNFPDPDTIRGLAVGLGVTVTDIVMASARSLALPVYTGDDPNALSIGGAGALPGSAKETLATVAREFIKLTSQLPDGVKNEDASTQGSAGDQEGDGGTGVDGTPMKPKHPDNVRHLTRPNQPQHVDEDFDDMAPPPDALDFVARETPPGYKKGYDIDREDDDS